MKAWRDTRLLVWTAIVFALSSLALVALLLSGLASPPQSGAPPVDKSNAVATINETYSLGSSAIAAGDSLEAIQDWALQVAYLLDKAEVERLSEGAADNDTLLVALSVAQGYAERALEAETAREALAARSQLLNSLDQIMLLVRTGDFVVIPPGSDYPLGLPRKPTMPDAPRPAPEPTPSMPPIPKVEPISPSSNYPTGGLSVEN